ncbi:Na+/H+ antiporter NhaA [Novosphingobium sp. PS1R-30]|uniref:Putative Na(+)/H(+) antiporter NhaA homolog n=1 Tax=Novosphingobium anseongense TaxID=3133436 RepID=A0ABU8S3U0_9SPHN
MLLASAALALVHANSPLGPGYAAMLQFHLGPLSIEHWINDGLMSVFFLLVGLEFKREMLDGQLSTWSRRILPRRAAAGGLAAAGGMLAPALIYLSLTAAPPLLAGRYGGAAQRAK